VPWFLIIGSVLLLLSSWVYTAQAQVAGCDPTTMRNGQCTAATCSGSSGSCWCDDACCDPRYKDCCKNFYTMCKIPVVDTISPNYAATNPTSVLVTISGASFGTTKKTLTWLRFGATNSSTLDFTNSALSSAWSATKIVFVLPAGSGANLRFWIRNEFGNANQVLSPTFSYSAPKLTSVIPDNAPTQGGTLVTISGQNFGPANATVRVVFDGTTEIVPSSWSHTQIVFVSPATNGGTAALTVTVTGQGSNELQFRASAPTISAVAPTTGIKQGTQLTITGSSFGTSGATVALGLGTCAVTTQSHTQIICTAPVGCCTGQQIRVTKDAQLSNTMTVSYAAPSVTSIAPQNGPTAGGTAVTIKGTSFYTTGTISFGGVLCPGTSCTVTSWGDKEIRLNLPAGQGASQPVTIYVGDQQSSGATYTYGRPVVSQITPAGASTQGGTSITIQGTNFGTSATVTVGGASCPVTTRENHVKLVCTLPAGAGANRPVVVTSAGLTSDGAVYSYGAPVITEVSPTSGSTAGGYLVTLTGSNFYTTGSVTIGGVNCPYTSWSHNSIQCAMAAGAGQDLAVVVTVSGQSGTAPQTFTFNPPTITQTTPTEGYTSGGETLTVLGDNFGTSGTVTIGDNECETFSHTHTEITCTIPVGRGDNLPVAIDIGGQTASSPDKFTYRAPSIAQVTPLFTSSSGGTLITVTGTSFDTGGKIAIGTFEVLSTAPGVTWGHSQITFPAPAGQGKDLSVTITTTGGKIVSTPGIFSYNPPAITSITPTSAPTNGGTELTIFGTSFGTSPIVTVGGVTCPIVTATHSQIKCTLPEGQGVTKSVIVSAGDQDSSAAVFSYSDPVITDIQPSDGPTTGGVLVTLTGTSFGTSDGAVTFNSVDCIIETQTHNEITCWLPEGQGTATVSLVLGNSQISNVYNYKYHAPIIDSIVSKNFLTQGGETLTINGQYFGTETPVVQISGKNCPVTYSSQTEIQCTTPPNEGVGLNILVVVGGQTAVRALYNTGIPVITEAPTADSKETVGGSIVTITGYNFGLTGTVTIGGLSCPVVTRSHTTITCTLSPGAGSNLPVSVTVQSRSNVQNAFSIFSYDPIEIDPVGGIVEPTSPTSGGGYLTINGKNFGPAGPGTVLIGTRSCYPIGAGWDHTRILCTVPAGQGKDLEVSLTRSGETAVAAETFSYHAPSVTELLPTDIDSAGNVPITITGTNLGVAATVTVGGLNCPVVSQTHTQVVCTAPPGTGSSVSVTVSVGGQDAPEVKTLNYKPPQVVNINPSLAYSQGGNTAVISGSSFGGQGVVMIGSFTATVISWTHNQIQITIPEGYGKDLPVVVEAFSGLSSSGAVTFSYRDPIISTFTPSTVLTGGGSRKITISGTSLTNGVGITKNVTIDGAECEIVSWGHNSIECNAPEGQGQSLPLVAHVNGVQTNTLLFSYASPTISSFDPNQGPTQGGIDLTIYGQSFGTHSASVTINSKGCPVTSQTHNEIVCTLPSGSSASNELTVTIGTVASNTVFYSYHKPVVTEIDPTTGITNGAYSVTIRGENFGETGAAVSIGGVACPIDSQDHEEIVCTMPEGDGQAKLVHVGLGSLVSSDLVYFDYEGPTVTTIDPTSGPTTGSIVIQINGTSFGLDPIVTIGGASCTRQSFSHNHITCLAPAGQGQNQTVVVRAGSVSATSPIAFDYDAAKIISVDPPTGPTSGGTVVTVTGTSFGLSGTIRINGNICTQVPGSYSHTSAKCVVPPGGGTDLVVSLVSGNQEATQTGTFSYNPPMATEVQPQNGPTAGGIPITILGSNFALDGTVTVGGAPCDLSGAGWSHTRIECTLPEGVGMNQEVIVTATTVEPREASPLFFNYDGPILSTVSPTSIYTSGNVDITITGSNFGTNAASVQVKVGGEDCPIVGTVTHNEIVCTAPSGSGTDAAISVTVGSRSSTTPLSIAFKKPVITSIAGCEDNPPVTEDCPVEGATITITGESFGSTVPTVYVNGKVCDDVTMTIAHQQVTCKLKPAVGFSLPVILSTGALSSDPFNGVSFAGPRITAGTIRKSGDVADTSIALSTTEGGEHVIFNGEFFGNTLSDVGVYYGIPPDYKAYQCTVVSVVDSEIECSTAPGVGAGHVFTVEVLHPNPDVGVQTSLPGSDTMSYPAPSIVGSSLRLASDGVRTDQLIGTVTQGQVIQFDVENLGTEASKVTVVYAKDPVSQQYSCTPVSIIIGADFTSVQCTTGQNPGDEGPYHFRVKVDNQWSGWGTDSYKYPTPPSVTRVRGCPVEEDDATTECPTTGQVVLTIEGDNFSTSSSTVRVGSYDCSPIIYADVNQIQCELPAGVGANLPVVVSVVALFSPSRNLVSYAAPTLTSISGCTGSGASTTNCPRTGTMPTLTIMGNYFGVSGAVVFIGDTQVTGVTHDSITPQTKLTLTLPEGFGLDRDVMVIQSGGQSATGLKVSYQACSAGTYENNGECTPCGEGTYTDTAGQYACTACPAGKYQTGTGKSRCIDCETGKYQTLSGQTSCIACSDGYVASTTGLSECTPCSSGKVSNGARTNCVNCPAGKFATLTSAATHCEDCEAGRYSAAGSVTCAYCGPGTYSEAGKSTCQKCAAGYVQPNSGQSGCIACGDGTYVDTEGQATCLACPGGTYVVGTANTVCDMCSSGTYSTKVTGSLVGPTTCPACGPGTYTAQDAQQSCLQCPQGTYNSGTGQSECTPCEAGKFSDGLGATKCTACAAGSYADTTGSVTCIPCDVGSFSVGTGNTNCSSCGAGEYQDETGKTRCKQCAKGTYTDKAGQPNCVACESGKFAKDNGQTTCEICPKGQYSQRTSSVGPTTCSICVKGKFSASQGQAQCASCPVGTYGDIEEADSCTNCPAGTYNPEVGQTTCLACALGTYSVERSPSCTECGPGTFAPTTSVTVCESCAVGKFTSGFKSTTCQNCPTGKYNSQTGQSVCLNCPIGYFSATSQATVCQACAAGKYNPTPGMSTCQSCDTGKFTNVVGQSTCIPCPRGEYASGLESTQCQACEPGKFGDRTGLQVCSTCGQGEYTPVSRLTSCLACPAGTYQAGTSASKCTSCEVGKFNAGTRTTVCMECEPGTYAAVEGLRACTFCEAGKYQADTGKTTCIPCERGKASAVTRSTACESCAKGRYAASEGSVSCVACPVGQFANETESHSCTPCPTGTYQNAIESSRCKDCAAGSFTSEEGQAVCTLCTSGKYASSEGSSTCDSCDAGKFSISTSGAGPSTCEDCPVGKIQPNIGQATCQECPAGSYGYDGECHLCEPGKYQPEAGQLSCLECPAGTYTSESGALACLPCGLGTYQPAPNSNKCEFCPAGKFSNILKATTCTACASGKIARNPGAASCVECPAGTYNPRVAGVYLGDTCESCPIGKFQPSTGKTVCTDCPQGRFVDTVGQVACIVCSPGTSNSLTGQSECTPCEAGKFASDTEQLECEVCPEGTFTSETGSYSCNECPAGRYGDSPGASACTTCETGKYQESSGHTACVDCTPGTYADTEGLTACLQCSPGEYGDPDNPGTCTLCPVGTYQPEPGRSSCFECPAGRYTNSEGALSCRPCPAGSFSVGTKNTECQPCGPGTYQDDTGQTTCKECEAGTANAADGQTRCLPCNSGYYSAQPGALECHMCIPGKYSTQTGSLTGPTVCADCAIGTYQPSSAQERCFDCPPGTYNDELGASQCQSCEPGKYNQQTGQSVCAECGVGTYSTQEMSVQCLECPVGYFQNTTGKTECEACPAGKYQDTPGSFICKDCAQGYYQSSVGQFSCLPCQLGKASDALGLSECPDCPAGKFAENYGQRACEDCPAGRFQAQPGQSKCNPCQPGTYYDGEGDGTACLPCPKGTAQSLPGNDTCELCKPGEYQPETGQAVCLACPPGTYGIEEGQPSCIACEPGKYQDNPMQQECKNCAIGRYSAIGAPDCKVCEEGSVNAVEGSPLCHVCDPTVSTANLLRTECLCNSGYFLPNYDGLYPNGYTEGTNDWKCESCIHGADCRAPGTRWSALAALPGWWRPTNTSRNFYRCALPSYCPGGEAGGSDYLTGDSGTPCSNHRTGVMCQACEEGYKSGIGGVCEKCPDDVANWIVMILLLVIVVFVLAFSVYLLWRGGDSLVNQINTGRHEDELSDNDLDYDEELEDSSSDDSTSDSGKKKDTKAEEDDDGLESESIEESTGERVVLDSIDPYTTENFEKAYPRPKEPEDSITYKLKILVSFLQIATNVGSGLDIQWPDTYKSFVLFFDFANVDYILSSITSAECYSAIDYYSTWTATVIFPALVLFLMLIFWVIPRHFYLCCYRHMTVQQNIRSKMRSWQLALYFLFLIYPSVSSTVIYHFVCKDIVTYEKTYSYLVKDLRVECYTDKWYTFAYVAIPLVLVYPIGIPAYFFYLLYKHRDDLNTDRRIQAQFGFLYMSYRDETWWWELVDLTHKLFQTSLLSFFPDDVRLPVGMALAILYMISILIFCPYVSKANDAFSLLCQNLIFLLMLAGYFFYDMGSTTLSKSEDIGMSICLLVATAIFLAMFVYLAGMSLVSIVRNLRSKLCPAKVEEKDLTKLQENPKPQARLSVTAQNPRRSLAEAAPVQPSAETRPSASPVAATQDKSAMDDSDISYSDTEMDSGRDSDN